MNNFISCCFDFTDNTENLELKMLPRRYFLNFGRIFSQCKFYSCCPAPNYAQNSGFFIESFDSIEKFYMYMVAQRNFLNRPDVRYKMRIFARKNYSGHRTIDFILRRIAKMHCKFDIWSYNLWKKWRPHGRVRKKFLKGGKIFLFPKFFQKFSCLLLEKNIKGTIDAYEVN